MSDLGAAAHAVADLVKRRRRVPYDEAVRLAGAQAVLGARARGLVRLEGFGRHADLVPGNGVSMFDPRAGKASRCAGVGGDDFPPV
jgi:hypothetical protein